jgi:hypothetical protein
MNSSATFTVRVVGRFERDKGANYLTTDRGWIGLDNVESLLKSANIVSGRIVRVCGSWTSVSRIHVTSITDSGVDQNAPSDKSYFHVHPIDKLRMASTLRGRAHSWLRERDFTELLLPSVWGTSEEYGVEEFSLAHSQLGRDSVLKLLQSPEYVLWAAMAEGVDSCFSFARCFRFEADPPPGRSGDYLTEFEQLVIARPATSLLEMVDLAQEFVIDLSRAAGLTVNPEDFRRVSPPGLGGTALPGSGDLGAFLLLTIPATWPANARQITLRRLTHADAIVHSMDSGPTIELQGLLAGDADRWVIEPGPHADEVFRILDVVQTLMDGNAVSDAQALQWNATWNIAPPRRWRAGETRDSNYDLRSINSQVVVSEDGVDCIADAELYVAGREVVHVRAYADVEQFRANLKEAGVGGLDERFAYLMPSLHRAPGGIVGVFIGWERLMSILSSVDRAADLQLFPRLDATGGPSLPWAETNIVAE